MAGVVTFFAANVATLGLLKKITDGLEFKDKKKEIQNTPDDELMPKIPDDAVLTPVNTLVDGFVGFFKNSFQSGLIDPISEQIEKAQAEFDDREKRLKEVGEKLEKTHTEKARFEEQVEEADRLAAELI